MGVASRLTIFRAAANSFSVCGAERWSGDCLLQLELGGP